MSDKPWMIYGANGYTGQLIAREAVRRGLRPVLAGRSAGPVQEMAAERKLESRVFRLEDPALLVKSISDCHLVLHCAGPFSETSQPMIEACLNTGTHYLDITGEIGVFANAHRQAEEARHADIVLIPGVGFDVVPSDCLATSLVQLLPAATQLTLAFEATGGVSPGTAKTSVEGLARGGAIRRDGKIVSVPLAYKSRTIPFAHAERVAMTIPWGDVFTAYISTGIPNIEVYMAAPPATIRRLRRLRWLHAMLATSWVQKMMKARIDRSVTGPGEATRGASHSQLWGEASSSDGRHVSGTMTTPNGYDLTATAGLGIVQYLLQNDVEGGFYTPSLLMGADYACSLPGVSMNLGAVSTA